MCKDFTGYKVFSTDSGMESYNGRIVERTIRKAMEDRDSTLYVVKLKGIRGYMDLYENEMYK